MAQRGSDMVCQCRKALRRHSSSRSKLQFGCDNHVVLHLRQMDAAVFRGITIEHLPEQYVERELESL